MPIGAVCVLHGEEEGPPVFNILSLAKKIVTGFNIFLWLELEGESVL